MRVSFRILIVLAAGLGFLVAGPAPTSPDALPVSRVPVAHSVLADSTLADSTLADSTLADSTLADRLAAFAARRPSVVGVAAGVVDARGRETASVGVRAAGGDSVDANTLFQIGSMTKVFTALALAVRAETGALHPGDAAAGLLPDSLDVPTRDGTAFTLAHLAAHTSGLPRMPKNLDALSDFPDPMNPYAAYTSADLYDALDGATLQSVPGSTYAYSNFGMGLLGQILARANASAYETAIVESVADPLGLSDTRVTLSDALDARAATSHGPTGDVVPDWSFTDAMAGAGALYADVSDVLAFLNAQCGRGDVPDVLQRAIDRSHTVLYDAPGAPTPPTFDVAYGWHVLERNGRRVLWHNGATLGSRSFVAVSPEHGAGVVLLANSGLQGDAARDFEATALHVLDARIDDGR